jgi:hypothetical protein
MNDFRLRSRRSFRRGDITVQLRRGWDWRGHRALLYGNGSLPSVAGVAYGAQLRKSIAVLGPVGVFFCCDDVIQSGSVDDESLTMEHALTLNQFFVHDETAVGGCEAGEHVERTGIGHLGGDGQVRERGSVDLHRQQIGLRVGHARDPKTGIEFPHGLSQTV